MNYYKGEAMTTIEQYEAALDDMLDMVDRSERALYDEKMRHFKELGEQTRLYRSKIDEAQQLATILFVIASGSLGFGLWALFQ